LRGHAKDGTSHNRPGPGVADERFGDTGSASAGVEGFVRSELSPPPARVLEVGCGTGELALALSAGGWRVTAVDPRAPEGEPFIRAAVEDLDAADHAPFDAAVAVLSLHHAGDIGSVLDGVRSLLRPGGVFVVDEFRKEHLSDRPTAAFFYYQQLSLIHAGRSGSGDGAGGGHRPDESPFESWYAGISGRRAGVHGEGDIVAALEERFATRSVSYGPYLYRHGLDAEMEPLERKLIEEGGIRPTGLRWVGVRGS
jgi:SAM-dependent methyltransferase